MISAERVLVAVGFAPTSENLRMDENFSFAKIVGEAKSKKEIQKAGFFAGCRRGAVDTIIDLRYYS